MAKTARTKPDVTGSIASADAAEAKAAEKAGTGNPNKVENPFASSMTTDEAEAIIKKHGEVKEGAEIAPELVQARKVVGIKA